MAKFAKRRSTKQIRVTKYEEVKVNLSFTFRGEERTPEFYINLKFDPDKDLDYHDRATLVLDQNEINQLAKYLDEYRK